jgi:hypothetical protein
MLRVYRVAEGGWNSILVGGRRKGNEEAEWDRSSLGK